MKRRRRRRKRRGRGGRQEEEEEGGGGGKQADVEEEEEEKQGRKTPLSPLSLPPPPATATKTPAARRPRGLECKARRSGRSGGRPRQTTPRTEQAAPDSEASTSAHPATTQRWLLCLRTPSTSAMAPTTRRSARSPPPATAHGSLGVVVVVGGTRDTRSPATPACCALAHALAYSPPLLRATQARATWARRWSSGCWPAARRRRSASTTSRPTAAGRTRP